MRTAVRPFIELNQPGWRQSPSHPENSPYSLRSPDEPAPRGAGGGVTAGGAVLVRAGAGLPPPVLRAAAPGDGAGPSPVRTVP